MKKPTTERILTLVTVAVIIAFWFIITSTGSFSETIIPSPKNVINCFADIISEGYKNHTLWEHLGTSLWRLVVAYILVIITAIPLGLLSGYNSKVRAIIDPIIEFYRPLPPHIIAVSGIDVLCHAIEGYISRNHQPICDALTLDYFLKVNKSGDRTLKLAKELGYENVDVFADRIHTLKKELGLRIGLKER